MKIFIAPRQQSCRICLLQVHMHLRPDWNIFTARILLILSIQTEGRAAQCTMHQLCTNTLFSQSPSECAVRRAQSVLYGYSFRFASWDTRTATQWHNLIITCLLIAPFQKITSDKLLSRLQLQQFSMTQLQIKLLTWTFQIHG